MSTPNPKCSSCSCYFVPTLKSSGLPYKTCGKCRNTDKTWREGNQEHNISTYQRILQAIQSREQRDNCRKEEGIQSTAAY